MKFRLNFGIPKPETAAETNDQLSTVRVDPAHLEGLAERQAPFHDGGVERIKPRDRYVGWKRASIVGDGHSLPALHVICRGPTPEGTARSLSAHCKPC